LENPYIHQTIFFGGHIVRLPHGFNDLTGYKAHGIPNHINNSWDAFLEGVLYVRNGGGGDFSMPLIF
jgi:hypothetical protein